MEHRRQRNRAKKWEGGRAMVDSEGRNGGKGRGHSLPTVLPVPTLPAKS